MEVLQATYAAHAGLTPSVNEYDLTTSGWRIATAGHGDGMVTSEGYGIYLNQSAWFAFEWTSNSNSGLNLMIQTSVPPGATPITCGQTPAADSTQLLGIALPAGAFQMPHLIDATALAPACADDVEHFYEAVLPTAGWSLSQPFANISYDPGTSQVKAAVFTRGSAKATITIAGYPGTQTVIIVTVA